MITEPIYLTRRDKKAHINWVYKDQEFTKVAWAFNTARLAIEEGVLPSVAQAACGLIFPWDYLPR